MRISRSGAAFSLLITILTLRPALAAEPLGHQRSQHFEVPTEDGLSVMRGQIDFPVTASAKHPLVVMVPGTGLFDRDAAFGTSNTEGDLVFKTIAARLNERGLAVLRYDYRGIKCSQRTAPPCPSCKTPDEKRTHFIKSCINNQVRATVTPENIREDILTVYRLGLNHPRIDPKRIVVFGHSEGSVNLSHLIKDRRIEPHAAVLMGGLAESLVSVIHWQIVGRIVDGIMAMDTDRDGVATNHEIARGHEQSRLKNYPIEMLQSPTGSWTEEGLRRSREAAYEQVKAEALSQDDAAPYGAKDLVQASYRWWKMFFTDDTSIFGNFIGFKGQATYCNGDFDAQVDFERQSEFISRHPRLPNLELVKFSGVGHTLGEDPIFGPVAPTSMKQLIDEIESAATLTN